MHVRRDCRPRRRRVPHTTRNRAGAAFHPGRRPCPHLPHDRSRTAAAPAGTASPPTARRAAYGVGFARPDGRQRSGATGKMPIHETRNLDPACDGRRARRARRPLSRDRGRNLDGPAHQPAGRPSRGRRNAGRRRDPRNARGNRAPVHARRARRRLSRALRPPRHRRRDLPALHVLRRGRRTGRGPRARRRHRPHAVDDGRRTARVQRASPLARRDALRRRLSRRAAHSARFRAHAFGRAAPEAFERQAVNK